ncbi:MAG: hypothetical protein SOZ58_07905 [Prevotella sp.]|nr:hypothetical protein [Prevotella sp.]
MKRKLTGILLMSALLVGGASTFVSCKDYDGDQVADINAQVGSLKEIVDKQKKDLEALRDRLDPNEDGALYKSVDSFLKGLDLEISSDAQKLNEINAFAVKLKNLVNYDWSYLQGLDNNQDFMSMVASANKVNSFIQNATTAGWGDNFENLVTLEQLNEAIAGLSGCQCDLSGFLKSDELLEKAVAAGLIEKSEVENMLKGYYTKEEIDNLLKEKVTSADITAAIDALKKEIEEKLGDKLDTATFEEFKKAYTEDFDALTEKVDGLEGDLADLGKRVKDLEELATEMATLQGIIENLSEQVGKNATNIATNATKIANNTAAINTLTTSVEALEGRLDNFVTGINVDKVSNPIFGSLNLPFGVKSTVLCGIYGSNLNGVVFPVAGDGEGYVFDGQEKWTLASDAQTVTFEGMAQSEIGGNIYLSIQPNNVEAAGKAITLISRDRESYAPGYSLALLKEDNSKITTRSAKGGSYVAQAKIVNPSAAKVNIDKAELEDAARNVWNSIKDRTMFDVPTVAKTIYSTFKNAIPEYYAVDYAWMDGETEKHVWSDYDIAAITIKPLSYETLKGRGASISKSIPQIEEYLGINLADYHFKWEDLGHMDDVQASVTVEIPDASKVTINGVPAPEVQVHEDKIVTIPTYNQAVLGTGEVLDYVEDVEVKILDGVVTIGDIDFSKAVVTFDTKKETYSATVSMKDFNKMIDDINSQVGGMMGKVNDLVDKIQSGFDKINNSVIARLNNAIAKVNKITENPNKLLQPVMVYNDVANGTGRLSESPIAPTLFKLNGESSGSVAMYPTSYTAELLAPAYKKYVQVTPLDGGTASFSKRMLDAGHSPVTFTATAGKYEIVYAAIDFYGNRVAKKYYVEVK